MKEPKCPKTMTGNHSFFLPKHVPGTYFVRNEQTITQVPPKEYTIPRCEYCGIYDDRKQGKD